ncbi:hypothetical protein [Nostoc sp.]|uniref:hypothetical protein n=1 Tax=Nostoc sp. TaxID=1180 RepID=UPI002FF67AD4
MLKSRATKAYCNLDENRSLSRLLGIKSVLIDYVFVAVTKVIEYFSQKFIVNGYLSREKVLLKTKHSQNPISYLGLHL